MQGGIVPCGAGVRAPFSRHVLQPPTPSAALPARGRVPPSLPPRGPHSRAGCPTAAVPVSPRSRHPAEPLSPLQVKNVADGASVQDETATLAYSEKPTSPITAPPYSPPSYSYPPQNGYCPPGTYSSQG